MSVLISGLSSEDIKRLTVIAPSIAARTENPYQYHVYLDIPRYRVPWSVEVLRTHGQLRSAHNSRKQRDGGW
jgi:hypothetical protein